MEEGSPSSIPSPSQALATKRIADATLMPPPSAPPIKRIKRPSTVLDEDTYTNALSQIIARDFFPGLVETQTKQEFLDALESKDRAWIASAGKKVEELMTSGRRTTSTTGTVSGRGTGPIHTTSSGSSSTMSTPRRSMNESQSDQTGVGDDDTTTTLAWGGDTPASVRSMRSAATTATATTMRDRTKPDISNLSLGAFQAKYTSEDNESFNKLVDKQNAKRREKHTWMWNGNKILSARQLAYRQREAKRIAAESRNTSNSNNIDKQLVLKTDLDARPAKPDTWKSTAENNLMFSPSGIEDTHETVQQRAEQASRAGPKRVIYNNTRLQHISSFSPPPSVPQSPSLSAIQDAIAGHPRPTASEPGYLEDGGETPRVNGYSFVDEDEPEPESGSPRGVPSNTDEAVDNIEEDAAVMAAYHLKLISDDLSSEDYSTPNPFIIKENRKREALHHRMVERVARSKRVEKIAKETKTPVPRFPSSPMLNFPGHTPLTGSTTSLNSGRSSSGIFGSGGGGGKMLTPAAQKLLQKVGSTPRASSSSLSKDRVRNMWTPTPKRGK